MRQLALSPQWIALLLVALAVAAVFAWLGKWQVERAIIQGAKDEFDTEVAVSLESIATPSAPLISDAAGRRVTVTGMLDLGSLIVVGNRVNDAETGCWVTGRLVTQQGSLAVALGWTPSREECDAVRDSLAGQVQVQVLSEWSGRYSPPEAPETPTNGTDPEQLDYMSVAALYNLWDSTEDRVYAGYLIAEVDQPGLERISSTPPISDASLNILNVFYAVEWIVFAAGAVFLWWRLLRDDFERRNEP